MHGSGTFLEVDARVLHIHSSAGHGTTSQLGRMLQLQMPSRHGVPVGVDRSRGSVRASAASSSEVGIGPVGKEAGLARAPRGCREAQAAARTRPATPTPGS